MKNEEEEESIYMSYNPNKTLVSVMSEYVGDFSADLFQELLTRKEISHLFLSDIETLTNQIQHEFPDIIQTESIGQTWEHRDIMVIELDARKLVNSEAFKTVPVNKKVEPAAPVAKNQTVSQAPPAQNATSAVQKNATQVKEAAKKDDDDDDDSKEKEKAK